MTLGVGGISVVARATGLARGTIRPGIRDLASGERLAAGPVRRPGAGPKRKYSGKRPAKAFREDLGKVLKEAGK